MKDRDEKYMREALLQAEAAAGLGEVPVGCVVVCGEEVIGRGHNLREKSQRAAAHAEMLALEEAARSVGSWRLDECEVYVTLEPCPMCSGAVIQARVKRLIYGAEDPKAGAAGSVVDLFRPGLFNHDVEVTGGVMAEESSSLLSRFFKSLRQE